MNFNAKFYDGKNGNAVVNITANNIAEEIPSGTVCTIIVKCPKISLVQGKATLVRDLFTASLNRYEGSSNDEPPPPCDDSIALEVRGNKPVDSDVEGEDFDVIEEETTTETRPEITYDSNEISDVEGEEHQVEKKKKKKSKKGREFANEDGVTVN